MTEKEILLAVKKYLENQIQNNCMPFQANLIAKEIEEISDKNGICLKCKCDTYNEILTLITSNEN